jgi:hypothetical protein
VRTKNTKNFVDGFRVMEKILRFESIQRIATGAGLTT